MGNSIFWYQPEELNKDDIISLNGQILPKGIEKELCFKTVREISAKAIKHNTPWCGMVKGLYFVKGCLDARDEKGRIMSFLFISDEKNGKDALMNELNVLGYKMQPATETCVNKKASQLPNWALIALAIALFAVIIAIAILITSKNENENENNIQAPRISSHQ